MAASHVQTLTPTDETATGTSVAMTPNAPTTQGNLLVVAVEAQGNDVIDSVTDTQGNTWVVDSGIANGTVCGLSLAYTFQDVAGLSTTDTITAHLTSSPAKIIGCDEFSGILSRDSSITNSGTDTAPTGSGALSSQDDTLFYCAVAYAGAGGAFTPGAGFTGTYDHNLNDAGVNRDLAGSYRIASAAETPTYGGTLSSSRQWALIGISFAAEPPGGGAGPQTIPADKVQDSSVKLPASVLPTGSAPIPAAPVADDASVETPTVTATGTATVPMDSFGSGVMITPNSAHGSGTATVPMDSFGSGAIITPTSAHASGSATIPAAAGPDTGSVHAPASVAVSAAPPQAIPAAAPLDESSVEPPAAVTGSGSAVIPGATKVQSSDVKRPATVHATGSAVIPHEQFGSGAIITPNSVTPSGSATIPADSVESGTVHLPTVQATGTVVIPAVREQGTSVKKPVSVFAGAPVPQSIPAEPVVSGDVLPVAFIGTIGVGPQTIPAVKVQGSSVKKPVSVTVGAPPAQTILAEHVSSGTVHTPSFGVEAAVPVPTLWGWGEGHFNDLEDGLRARTLATLRVALGANALVRCDLDTTTFNGVLQKWIDFDAEVTAAGLIWLPVLHAVWPSGSGHTRYQIPPRDGGTGEYAMQSWYLWVKEAVLAIGPKRVYELWNEPNTPTGNGNDGASGDMAYADLQDIVEAGCAAIRDAAVEGGFGFVPYIIGPALGSIDVAYLEGWIAWAEANGRVNPLTLYDAQGVHIYPHEDPSLAGGLDKVRRIKTLDYLRDSIDAHYPGPGQSPDLAMTEWSYSNDNDANMFNGGTSLFVIWEDPAHGAANAEDYTRGLLDQITTHPEWRVTYRTAYHPVDQDNGTPGQESHHYQSYGGFYDNPAGGTGAIPEQYWKGNGRVISEKALGQQTGGGVQRIYAAKVQVSSVKKPKTVFGSLIIQAATVMPCYTESTQTSLGSGQQSVPLATEQQYASLAPGTQESEIQP